MCAFLQWYCTVLYLPSDPYHFRHQSSWPTWSTCFDSRMMMLLCRWFFKKFGHLAKQKMPAIKSLIQDFYWNHQSQLLQIGNKCNWNQPCVNNRTLPHKGIPAMPDALRSMTSVWTLAFEYELKCCRILLTFSNLDVVKIHMLRTTELVQFNCQSSAVIMLTESRDWQAGTTVGKTKVDSSIVSKEQEIRKGTKSHNQNFGCHSIWKSYEKG